MRNLTKTAWMLLLAVGGCAGPGIPRGDLNVTLTGLQEVPGPGDPGSRDEPKMAALRALLN